VLDAPTGTGRFLDMISGGAGLVVGADISLDMLRLASEASGQAIPLVLSEAERLPFRDDAFDVVVSIRFFQHLPKSQIIPIIVEMERVSRLGVLIQAPIRKMTSAPIKVAADAKRFVLHRGAGPRPPFRSQRPANRYFPVVKSEFERALGEAGLALSSTTFVTWPGAQLTLMHVVRV
jgi:ubiquinone/menaquinone biosynthesis C-methylase UbiE